MKSRIHENFIEMTNIPVKKFSLESYYTVGALPQHDQIKHSVLDAIAESNCDTLYSKDNYYNDRVYRLDWNQAKDFERPWVKLLLPHLKSYLDKLAVALGHQQVCIDEFWFQQYVTGDSHGWHVHGSNFTGVYYLELDPSSPRTEFIEPARQNKKITADVKEGDVLMFPSYTIHRAPVIQNDVRKTIVSFNFILDLINSNTLKEINQL
jgi:hypothetical protein